MSKPTRPVGLDYENHMNEWVAYADALEADARKLRKWVLVFRKYMAPFPPGEMLQVLEDTMYLGEDTHE